jgi:hypothetical protein
VTYHPGFLAPDDVPQILNPVIEGVPRNVVDPALRISSAMKFPDYPRARKAVTIDPDLPIRNPIKEARERASRSTVEVASGYPIVKNAVPLDEKSAQQVGFGQFRGSHPSPNSFMNSVSVTKPGVLFLARLDDVR